MTAISTQLPAVSKKRLVGFYIPLVLGSAAIIGWFGFTLGIFPVLLLGWFQPDLFGIHQIHEFGTAVLFSLLLTGMLIQFFRPERQVAAIIGMIVVAFTFISGGFDPVALLFLIFPLAGAIPHPARRELLQIPGEINWWLVGLAAVLATASFSYVSSHLQ